MTRPTVDYIRENYPQFDYMSNNELITYAHQKYAPTEDYKKFSESMGYSQNMVARGMKTFVNMVEKTIPSTVAGVGSYYKYQGLKSTNPEKDMSYNFGKGLIDWAKNYKEKGSALFRPSTLMMSPMDKALSDGGVIKPMIGVPSETEKKTGAGKTGSTFGSVASFMSLAPAGVVGQMGMLSGQYFLDISEEKPEWSETKKAEYAFKQGALATVMEKAGVSYITDPFTKLGKVLVSSAIKKTALYGTFRSALGGFIKGYAEGTLVEGLQEGTQQIGQNVIDIGYGLDRKIIDGVGEVMFYGGLAGGVIRGTGQSLLSVSDARKLKAQGMSDADIDNMSDNMASIVNKIIKDNPEQYKEAQDILKAGMADKSHEELITALQEKGSTYEEAKALVQSMNPLDVQTVNEEYQVKETKKTLKEYETEKVRLINEAVASGYTQEQAEQSVAVFDKAIEGYAKSFGKTKAETAKMVVIQKGVKPQKVELNQEDPLISEARKYKSAEEFARKEGGIMVSSGMDTNEIIRVFPTDLIKDKGITTKELMFQLSERSKKTESDNVSASAVSKKAMGYYKHLADIGYFSEFVATGNKFTAKLTEKAKEITSSPLAEIWNKAQESKPLYQEGYEKNLAVLHNLSEAKLAFTDRQGGLAVPSIAIGTKDNPLTGFGEISLIARPSMIAPSATAKTFNTDIYSPRYPSTRYDIEYKKEQELINRMKELGIPKDDAYFNIDRGMQSLSSSIAMQYLYLKETGKLKEVVYKKSYNPPAEEVLAKLDFMKKYQYFYNLAESEEGKADYKKFIELMKENLRIKGTKKKDVPKEFNDGFVRNTWEYWRDAVNYREKKVVDVRGTVGANDFNYTEEYDNFIEDEYAKLNVKEKIYAGENPRTGERKYKDNTLENAVIELKKELQDGEGFSYGIKNVRAVVAKQYRSLAEIQKDRNKIVSEEEMKEVVKETDELWGEILDEADKKYTKTSDHSTTETFVYVLKDAIKNNDNIKSELDKYHFVGMDMDKINLLLVTLKDMPTEYFESKVRRAVSLDEFVGAVIPYKSSQKTKDILEKNGIKYREMKQGEDRKQVISEYLDELNQKDDILFQTDNLGFYSQVDNVVEGINFKTMPSVMLANQLKKTQGIKQEELDYTGVIEWLEALDRKVTKEEVMEFLKDEGVQLEEVRYKEMSSENRKDEVYNEMRDQFVRDGGTLTEYAEQIFTDWYDNKISNSDVYEELGIDVDGVEYFIENSEQDTKHATYVEEGGTNYREVILTMPNQIGSYKPDSIHYTSEGNGTAIAWFRANDRREEVPNVGWVDPDSVKLNFDEIYNLIEYENYYQVENKETGDRYVNTYDKETMKAMGYNEEQLKSYLMTTELKKKHPVYKRLMNVPKTKSQKVLFIEEIQSKRHMDARKIRDKEVKRLMKENDMTKAEAQKEVSADFGYQKEMTEKDKALLAQRLTAETLNRELIQYENVLTSRLSDEYYAQGGNSVYKLLAIQQAYGLWGGNRTDYVKDEKAYDEILEKITEEEAKKLVEMNNRQRSAMMLANNTDYDILANSQKVPDAPFKKNWQELILKRIMREAVEQGYDKVAWTNGEQQAKRYNLSQVIRYIDATNYKNDGFKYIDISTENKLFSFTVGKDGYIKDQTNATYPSFIGNNLDEIVGEDVANKLLVEEEVKLDNEDLKLGGEGLMYFYNNFIPTLLKNKYGKTGATVGDVKLDDMYNYERQFKGEDKTIDELVVISENLNDNTLYNQIYEVMSAMNNGMSYKDAMTKYASIGLSARLGGTNTSEKVYEKIQSITITDEMKNSIMKGQALFQKAKGSFQKIDGKYVISLFEGNNASTLIHEMAHVFLTWSMETGVDIQRVLDFAGVKEINNRNHRMVQEKFARGFEAYLRTGVAPDEGMKTIFDKFKEWLVEVYKSIKELNITLTPEIISFFDDMMTDKLVSVESKEGLSPITLFQKAIDEIKIQGDKLLDKLKTKSQVKADIVNNIKGVQKEITAYINGLELEPSDKAKFIGKVKMATSERTLRTQIKKISARAIQLQEAQLKREYKKQIDKELAGTKDIKKGSRKIGRYDYETNKLFTDLKKYNKLSKEKALNEQNNIEIAEELPDGFERLRISFLQYKTQGLDSSLALLEQVYNDITIAKAIGESAKDEQDFKDRMNRLSERTEIVQAMADNKTQGNALLAQLGKLYAGGFGNIYSILSTVTNAEIADRYNLEKIESDRMIGVYFTKMKMITDSGEALGLVPKELKKYLEDMSNQKYDLIRNDGVVSEIDKTQLLHIYLGIKNEKVRDAYNLYFGSDKIPKVKREILGEEYDLSQQIASLLGNLSEKDFEMADVIQEIVQSYRDSNNEVHVRQTGKDLKMVENYFPMTSEYQIEASDTVPMSSEFASFQNERKGMAVPEPSNFWSVAEKHIEQSEQLKNVTEKYINAKKIFNSNQVVELNDGTKTTIKKFIEKRYGDGMLNIINKALDRSSMNRMVSESNLIDNIVGVALNNWIKSKISLNPNVFLSQFIGANNYMENMPVLEWSKYFMAGLANPKEAFDYMWKNSPYLQARYGNGYNEQLSRIMKQSKSFSQLSEWANALTFLTKIGDMGAIVYGGYPLMKYLEAQGKTTAEAEVIFREATMRGQQSGLGASISGLQASRNPFTRMFTAFKNTPQQYLRKIVDVQFQFANGDISAEQFVKTISIYAIIQPALFGFVSGLIPYALGGGDDDESFWEYSWGNIMRNVLLSPLLAIVLVGDISSAIYNRINGDRLYDVFNISMLNDIERATKKLAKEGISLGEVMAILAGIVGDVGLGLPAGQLIRYETKIAKLLEEM